MSRMAVEAPDLTAHADLEAGGYKGAGENNGPHGRSEGALEAFDGRKQKVGVSHAA